MPCEVPSPRYRGRHPPEGWRPLRRGNADGRWRGREVCASRRAQADRDGRRHGAARARRGRNGGDRGRCRCRAGRAAGRADVGARAACRISVAEPRRGGVRRSARQRHVPGGSPDAERRRLRARGLHGSPARRRLRPGRAALHARPVEEGQAAVRLPASAHAGAVLQGRRRRRERGVPQATRQELRCAGAGARPRRS